jgi:hypothetical protein
MAFDTGPRRTTAVALTADRRSMTPEPAACKPFSAIDPRSEGGLGGLVHRLRAERQTPAARRDQPLHAIALNAHVEVRQERRFGDAPRDDLPGIRGRADSDMAVRALEAGGTAPIGSPRRVLSRVLGWLVPDPFAIGATTTGCAAATRALRTVSMAWPRSNDDHRWKCESEDCDDALD